MYTEKWVSAIGRVVAPLALAALLGTLASPALLLREWEDHAEARAYPHGHLETGLWPLEQASAALARIGRAEAGLGLAAASSAWPPARSSTPCSDRGSGPA